MKALLPNVVATIDREEWEKPRETILKVGGYMNQGNFKVKVTHIVEMRSEVYVFGVYE